MNSTLSDTEIKLLVQNHKAKELDSLRVLRSPDPDQAKSMKARVEALVAELEAGIQDQL